MLLPMPFSIKRVVHVHRGIVIRIGFIPTFRTSEHFAPLFLDPQDAAWVGGAHRGYDACYVVGSVFVHAPYMPPELLIAVFPFDRFA